MAESIGELARRGPPAFEGPIRTIDDLRTVLKRQLWAAEMATRLAPDKRTSYLRGKRSVLTSLLERLDWPDACVKCGKSPVIELIEGSALCIDCVDLWNEAFYGPEGADA